MDDDDLEEIITIDETAFNRTDPRTIANLKALMISDPEGCFVVTDGNDIVGYNYSKSMGSEGYIGPLGLLPEYQNKGLGKILIQKTLDHLSGKCNVIGLEVLPEKGNIIGLYQKIGFISGFPSYLFGIKQDQEIKIEYSNEFHVENASNMTKAQFQSIIDGVDDWTYNSLEGLNFNKDLKATKDLKGIVLVCFDGTDPVGFLAYSKLLIPTLWGAVDSGNTVDNQKQIISDLLHHFNEINGFNEVILQINSRHIILVDMVLKMGFKLNRSVNRMYLKGFEGSHLKMSNNFIMRSWRG